jgi:hypothetical protein
LHFGECNVYNMHGHKLLVYIRQTLSLDLAIWKLIDIIVAE